MQASLQVTLVHLWMHIVQGTVLLKSNFNEFHSLFTFEISTNFCLVVRKFEDILMRFE